MANGKDCDGFSTLLEQILERCCQEHFEEGVERLLKSTAPSGEPTMGDPLGTIIHDVLTYLDAVLLDLQTAQEAPQSLSKSTQEEVKRNLGVALDRLRFLAGLSDGKDETRKWADQRRFSKGMLQGAGLKEALKSIPNGFEGDKIPPEISEAICSQFASWVEKLVEVLEKARGK
jgi:hypothetical protein